MRGKRAKKLRAALYLYLEGHLARGIEYWKNCPEGDWDIIPPGIVDEKALEFDRAKIPDMIPEEFAMSLFVWNSYRDGHLMYSGGRMDQPSHHNTVVSIYNDVYAKWVKSKRKTNGRS